MTKKFVNLPNNYKNLLDDVKSIFDVKLLEELANNKISYKDLSKTYKKIEKLCDQNNCNTYDLNKMINYYDKKNSVIEILKKIATLRNKYIVYYAQKSNLWNKNLNDIKSKFKKINNKNITLDKVENAFVKVLKSYKYDWDGLWSIIEVDKNGNTKNVSLFDVDDYEKIFTLLSSNSYKQN